MQKSENATLLECDNANMQQCENVTMQKCNNAKMLQCENVTMRESKKNAKIRQSYSFEEAKIRHGVNQPPYFIVKFLTAIVLTANRLNTIIMLKLKLITSLWYTNIYLKLFIL
jgi:hypothetical protein